jgi:pilus assembly protein CpaF
MSAVPPDVLTRVQEHILTRGIPIPGWHANEEEHRRFRAAIVQAMVDLRLDREFRDDGIQDVALALAGMMTGIGVLQPLLRETGVEEIIVRDGFVQVERCGCIEDVGCLADDDHFRRIAQRAADLGRRTLKGDRPYVVVDLPDGSRFTAIVPPLSARGTAINIRVFGRETYSLEHLAHLGMFRRKDEDKGDELEDVLSQNPDRLLARIASGNLATVLVSGEFGAGKTTLLSAMSQLIPPSVQVAVVETFEELRIAHPHALRVVVPEGRADFPSMDEVLNVVITRMRPDLLIIGEIVRDEAPRFLDAINLGKKAWSTIHGNDALGALYRLETKALVSGLPHRAIREQIAAGVDLVVHLRKNPRTGHRYVAQIVRVEGLDADGNYKLRRVFGEML